MQFSHLNLKKVRNNLDLYGGPASSQPDRRNFIRTIGLGMLAVNPLARTIRSLNDSSFVIRHTDKRFTVVRHGSVCWDISDSFFDTGRRISVLSEDDHYKITAAGLKVRGTSIGTSLNADIYRDGSSWMMNIEIPGLGIKENVDFCEWLDRKISLSSSMDFSRQAIEFSGKDGIILSGRSSVSLDSSWKISLTPEESINITLSGKQYASGVIRIEPFTESNEQFLKNFGQAAVRITVPGFEGWGSWLSGFDFNGERKLVVMKSSHDLYCLLSEEPGGTKSWSIWGNRRGGNLKFRPSTGSEEEFTFPSYFVYSEYLGQQIPQVYLAATLPDGGQWVSGRLGSLRIISNGKKPDLELFGSGTSVNSENCSLKLDSFVPVIEGAIALPVAFREPVDITINSDPLYDDTAAVLPGNEASLVKGPFAEFSAEQQDKPVRKKPAAETRVSAGKQNIRMNIAFNEVRLELKRAIRISLLRPEDLVQLDFEFHNFEFTNKGKSGFLQLADTSQSGLMIVYFPTQHTLEEAWFETSNVPTDGTQVPLALPARQIRAQKSRIVYEMEAGSPGFPMVMEELLDWSKFTMRVHPRAWIKLPSLFKLKPFTLKPVSNARLNKAQTILDKQDGQLGYSVRLIRNKRLAPSDDFFISENTAGKIITTEKSASLSAGFNLANAAKLQLKPGPVPADCTSIEAPALMYISPNQINDFSHRTDLKLKKTDPKRQVDSGVSTLTRTLEYQTGSQKGDIAELWHTRLGVRLRDGSVSTDSLGSFKTIRVLWAHEAREDYKYRAALDKPFMTSLSAADRHLLVHETSNYSEKFTPVPVPVKDLMLTTLGAYLNWHVFFKLPDEYTTFLNIIEWQHLATLGRDQYVKVVYEGYLFPFGHKAALVKVTQRKFNDETRAAVNRQRMYIVVLEHEVDYNRTDPDNKFIEFPFEKVRILNNYTPDIDFPGDSTLAEFQNPKLLTIKSKGARASTKKENVAFNFYICVGKEKFRFDLSATDKEGGEHKFRIPLVFVENYVGRIKENVEKILPKYNQIAEQAGSAALNNQKVAFAECLVDGDTAFETKSITFNGQYYPAKGTADLKFHPKLHTADIYIKQVEELTGKRETVQISIVDDINPGHIFASVAGASVDFTGGSDKSGGFLSPNLDITALSRLQGPVGGSIDSMKDMYFDAKDFFKSIKLPSAKIFGCIDIFSLLKVFSLNGTFNSYISDIEAIKSELENLRNDILSLENTARETATDLSASINAKKDEIKAKVDDLKKTLSDQVPRIPNFKTYLTDSAFNAEYRWQPEMQGKEIEVFPKLLTVNVKNPSTALSVTTKLERPFDTSLPSVMDGSARFEDFEVVVAQMIGVGFKYLEFKTGSSKKTDVRVSLVSPVPLSFMGPLSFVNSLQSIIPADGFAGNGPFIDLTPSGVTAGFTISVPTVGVGICTIANISLGASVTLPFTGAPLLLAFNFCTRENPFLLTISCFGGGGFFRLVTSLKQIEIIEASFEFGAAMSLDVGVASGSVSVMGGIYFKTEHTVINGYDANVVVLTGYIRLNGSLCIIGLITVSLEFYLAFTANFISKNGKDVVDKLVGEATLKVKVEILFFSTSVSVSVRREIQGADADPKFTDMILPEDWQEYCLAFAG
jgi:hypothetical protein